MLAAAPSVSAIFLCYNCEAFVADALRSVLQQDCEPIEIIVSDDASTDRTWEIVEREVECYAGPHRVLVRQQVENSGTKSAHLNHVFTLASGDILVSFDGDDVSEPFRVSAILEAFRADASVAAVYSAYDLMDEAGKDLGRGKVPRVPAGTSTRRWFAKVDAFASGTTLAVRSDVVKEFSELDREIHEDVLLPFRASLLGEVVFIPRPLVRARRHGASLTADLERFESVSKYRSRLQQGIEKARRNLGSRLDDIRTFTERSPEAAPEAAELRGVAERSMVAAERSADLMSESVVDRVSALWWLYRTGAYRDELAQNAVLALLPGAYLRYKRRKLRRR